ncbi:hypothetical protein V8D89_007932 [Ganoderma adspersum]
MVVEEAGGARKAPYALKKIDEKANPGSSFDATMLASDGSLKDREDNVDLTGPVEYRVSGAKMQVMSQKLAYRAVRLQKDNKTKTRARTQITLNKIKEGIAAAFRQSVPEGAIWKALRKKTVTREARQFMWRTIHDGYMVGTQWLRPTMSDEMKARATCKICNKVDSMDHILFECQAPERDLIWKLFKKTWALTKRQWHEPSWGTIAGAPLATFCSQKGKRMKEAEDLWTILATESLHLVWKMRCERVIQNDGAPFTRSEVRNRWYEAIERRLKMERMVVSALPATARSKGKQIERLEETWLPILENANMLPFDWVANCGVLVGIKRGR